MSPQITQMNADFEQKETKRTKNFMKATMTQEQIQAAFEGVREALKVFNGQAVPAPIGVCISQIDFSIKVGLRMSQDIEQGRDHARSDELGK